MSVTEVLVNTYLVGCLILVLCFILIVAFSKVNVMRHGWVTALIVVAGSWLVLGFLFYKVVVKDEKTFTTDF